VHDGVDVVLGQDAGDEFLVAGVADYQFAVGHGFAETGGEVVEGDDALAGLAELAHHVAADVAGAAGDEYALGHPGSLCSNSGGMLESGRDDSNCAAGWSVSWLSFPRRERR
jgi:hypothetical protein